MNNNGQGRPEARGWTPEQIIQAFKEVVTAILGLVLVVYTLITAGNTLTYVGDETRMSDAKDVLLLLLGLAGVVIGYYFGRVPADARATQAQQQANEASAQAEQVSVQAGAAADQVEQMLSHLVSPADSATRGVGGISEAGNVIEELQQLRDNLRQVANVGRRR